MDDDADGEHHGAHALPVPTFRLHRNVAHNSLRIAAFAVTRFNPAIAAVGARCFGHHVVHEPCVWHAWQPASPATARIRSRPAVSRASLISVHARLSAAGPRKSGRQPTTSHAA